VVKNVQKETYNKQRSFHIVKNRRMVCEKEYFLRQNMAKHENGQLTRLISALKVITVQVFTSLLIFNFIFIPFSL